MNAKACSGCGKQITFVMTEGGRHMPIDPEPHPAGTVVLTGRRDTAGRWLARVLTGSELPAQGEAYIPHWRNCPASPEFRRRKARLAVRCRVCQKPLDAVLAKREPTQDTHPCCDPRYARPPKRRRKGKGGNR